MENSIDNFKAISNFSAIEQIDLSIPIPFYLSNTEGMNLKKEYGNGLDPDKTFLEFSYIEDFDPKLLFGLYFYHQDLHWRNLLVYVPLVHWTSQKKFICRHPKNWHNPYMIIAKPIHSNLITSVSSILEIQDYFNENPQISGRSE